MSGESWSEKPTEHIFSISADDAMSILSHPEDFVEGWDDKTMSLNIAIPGLIARGFSRLRRRDVRCYAHLTAHIPIDNKEIVRGVANPHLYAPDSSSRDDTHIPPVDFKN